MVIDNNYELFGDHGSPSLATTLMWAGRGSAANLARVTRKRRTVREIMDAARKAAGMKPRYKARHR